MRCYRKIRVTTVGERRVGRPPPIYPQGISIPYRRLWCQLGLIASFALLTTIIAPAAATAAPGVTTIEVGSTAGWVQVPLALTQGKQYTLKASGSWTVDYRNFPKVGPAGYDSTTDKAIFQGCKIAPYPYARLLGKNGSGQPFSVGEASIGADMTNDALFLRINDADACLGDNDGSVFVEVRTGSSGSGTAPPLVNRDDIKKAILCGLSAAKLKIPDKDLRNAITIVLLGRNLAEVRNNLDKFFKTLIIGGVPLGPCFAPIIDPPPVS